MRLTKNYTNTGRSSIISLHIYTSMLCQNDLTSGCNKVLPLGFSSGGMTVVPVSSFKSRRSIPVTTLSTLTSSLSVASSGASNMKLEVVEEIELVGESD